MNAARVASLLRELADAIDAEPEAPAAKPSRPKRVQRPRAVVAPPGEGDAMSRKRAERILREHGLLEVDEAG